MESGLGFTSAKDLPRELSFQATRTFSAGVPNNLFYVGTAAPT